MNKEDIQIARSYAQKQKETMQYFGKEPSLEVKHLIQALDEIERLQTIIKTCDEQLTGAHYECNPYNVALGDSDLYGYQAVNWVHKTLSQAIDK